MKCPGCGSVRMETLKTEHLGRTIQRRRECLTCGDRWSTEEVMLRGTHATYTGGGRQPLPVGGNAGIPVGGESPPLDPPSGAFSGSLFPPEDPDQTRVEAHQNLRKVRVSAPKYPAEFERIWRETGGVGNKFPALKAWEKQGRPTADNVVAGWRWAEQHDRRWPNYVPHLSTWLNARGWEDRPADRSGTRPIKTVDDYKAEERAEQERRRVARQLEQEAAERTRAAVGGRP